MQEVETIHGTRWVEEDVQMARRYKKVKDLKRHGFAFVCDDETAYRIEKYITDDRFSTKGDGLRRLVNIGLEHDDNPHGQEDKE